MSFSFKGVRNLARSCRRHQKKKSCFFVSQFEYMALFVRVSEGKLYEVRKNGIHSHLNYVYLQIQVWYTVVCRGLTLSKMCARIMKQALPEKPTDGWSILRITICDPGYLRLTKKYLHLLFAPALRREGLQKHHRFLIPVKW
jgi:hypothetical protein